MNLTLFFIIISCAIGYMLFDTFKKSRQGQPEEQQSMINKIKVNYHKECKILRQLNEDKVNHLLYKNISST